METQRVPLIRDPIHRYSQHPGRICSEWLTVCINLGTVKRFAGKGKDWDFRVGLVDTFTLDSKAQAKMLELIEFLEAGKA